jgi:hypothetical protein
MVNIKYIQFFPPLIVISFMVYQIFFERDVNDSLCDGYKRYPKGIVKSRTYYKSVTWIELLGDSIPDYAYVIGNGDGSNGKIGLYNYLKEGDSLTRRGDSLYVSRKDSSTIWKIYKSPLREEWLRDCK